MINTKKTISFDEANMDENEKNLRKLIGLNIKEERKARNRNYKTNGIDREMEIQELINQVEKIDIDEKIYRKPETVYPINNTPNINKLLNRMAEFKGRITKSKNKLMWEEKKEAKKIIKICYTYLAHKIDEYIEILYQNNIITQFSEVEYLQKSPISICLVPNVNFEYYWLSQVLRFIIIILGYSSYKIEIDNEESLDVLIDNLKYLLVIYKDYVKVINKAILEQGKYLNKTVFDIYKDLHRKSISRIENYTNSTLDKIINLAEKELDFVKCLSKYC